MIKDLLKHFRKEARETPTPREIKREFYLLNPDQIPLDQFSEGQVRALARRALHQIMREGGTLGLGD